MMVAVAFCWIGLAIVAASVWASHRETTCAGRRV